MRKILLLLIVVLIMIACGKKQKPVPKSNYRVVGKYILIPQNSAIDKKLKRLKITKVPYSKTIQTPANIEGNPTKMAKITPPLAGRILKIYVKVGEYVNKGDALFTMNSPDFVDAQKNFLKVKQELLQAEINYRRQKDLYANGVGIKKELEESLRDLNIKKSEFNNAIAQLKLYGINYETMSIGDPLTIKAPVSGRVSGIEMTIGQFKNDLSEVVMVIADLSKVWLTANVKEKDIRFLHPGGEAIAQVVAYPGKDYKGTILFVDDTLNIKTHALKVRIEMPNPNRDLKPGMFATISFVEMPQASILIPNKALFQTEEYSFVFIQSGPGKYEKRNVQTSDSKNGKTLIISGLKEGEVIVSEGGFYLLDIR